MIPKKSGGTRQILSPIKGLKIIQQKLNQVLQLRYKTRPSVHGFVNDKCIVSNAEKHLNKKLILNIDLESFFPSINYGRVMRLFMAKPYCLPQKAATVLAQICCVNSQLPQGAPTSPVVSNMICSSLDYKLQEFARKYRCTYTRYADDITFSTTRKLFPQAIAFSEVKANPFSVIIGDELKNIIETSLFKINYSKVRILTKLNRQEVTGITVNEKLNVTRKYTNQIRAMLHAWRRYGLIDAEKEYISIYNKKHKGPFALFSRKENKGEFFKCVVKGKINYLRMVKGDTDGTVQKCCSVLAQLDEKFKNIYNKIRVHTYNDFIFVLEGRETDQMNQGTAFLLKNVGIVTCKHNIREKMLLFKGNDPLNEMQISKTLFVHENLEIVLLDMPKGISINSGFEIGDSMHLKKGEAIILLGFPNYSPGQLYQEREGKIAGDKILFCEKHYIIDCPVLEGNSGGPVLNAKGQLIGIASRGAKDADKAQITEHLFVPIHLLMEIIRERPISQE